MRQLLHRSMGGHRTPIPGLTPRRPRQPHSAPQPRDLLLVQRKETHRCALRHLHRQRRPQVGPRHHHPRKPRHQRPEMARINPLALPLESLHMTPAHSDVPALGSQGRHARRGPALKEAVTVRRPGDDRQKEKSSVRQYEQNKEKPDRTANLARINSHGTFHNPDSAFEALTYWRKHNSR